MAKRYYPKANRTAQNFGSGNVNMGSINKILLHTTETRDWPGYGGAGGHPTLTYNPWTHQWREHLPLVGSATALENAGSFQTNRDHVVQIEIVAYADPKTAKRYGHFVEDIDEAALKDLGEFIAWMHDEYGVKIASSVKWKDYPASYGNNGVRLSVAQFRRYRGVLGHQHAPGNAHGDPGGLDVAKIISYAKKAAGVKPKAKHGYGGKRTWIGKLWTLRKSEAYDGAGHRRPEYDLCADKQYTGQVWTNPFGDGRYFVTNHDGTEVGKPPHRIFHPLDNGDWSHTKNGKAIG